MKNCRECGIGLVEEENWYPSYVRKQNHICMECAKARVRQYCAEHREARAAYQRQYYAGHREEKKAYMRQYHAENAEHIAEQRRGYREKNRAHLAECDLAWARANMGKAHEKCRRRRALKANATIGPVDEAAIYERDKVCIYCGSGEDLTLDHLTPLANGGAHTQDNLGVACRSCNSRKGTKTYEEFREEVEGDDEDVGDA